MSSIEKFVDKLGKKAVTGAASRQDPSFTIPGESSHTNRDATQDQTKSSSSREVAINFERISAMGMLTLDQSKNQLSE